MRINISLKQAWIMLVLFTGFPPVFIAATWFGWKFYQEELHNYLTIERKANLSLSTRIESEVGRLKTLLAVKADIIDTLIRDNNDASGQAAINNILQDTVRREPAIHEVVFLHPDGSVITAIDKQAGFTGDTSLGEADQQAIRQHFGLTVSEDAPEVDMPAKGRSYIGATRIHDGTEVFSMSQPVGEPVWGIMAVLVHVDELWKSNKWHLIGHTSREYRDYIVDSRGTLLSNVSGDAIDVGQSMTNIPIVGQLVAGAEWPEDRSYTGIDGQPVFGTYTTIPMLHWNLISEVPSASVTTPIWRALASMAIITVAGLLIFIVIVFDLARRTLEPIKKACEAIDSVAKGDFDKTLDSCGISELDMLSSGFNEMLAARKSAEHDLRVSQKKLASSEAIFRGVIESSADGVILINLDGEIVLVNQAIVSMTGYSEESLLASSIEKILPGRFHPDKILQPCPRERSADDYMCANMENLMLKCNDGEDLPVEIRMAPVITEYGRLISIMFQDISLRKLAEEKILFQAHYDSLTKLPNRILSLDRLSQLMNEGVRDEELVAILFLDLDDFKKVNDSLGHEVGDKLLVEAANRLRLAVRKGDTVGRLGGDEFIVLLGGIDSVDDVQAIVENIINNFRSSFKIDGREFLLTISVGVAMYPGDGETGSQLLRNADSAMYHAKSIGRNTYSFFKDEMNHNVSRRLALEEQLHGAFEREEFEVLFQPKVCLEDGSLIGAEALLRWHNAVLGTVSPAEFIPIAERTGFIVTLGKFVLNEAIGMVGHCQRLFGSSFRMAVNLSPRQFRDPNLVPFIKECLQNRGVSSDCLEMEITEGVLMSGHAYIDEAIADIKAMNITLAMDDFGTGYSSLSYLRKYPFDVLKIDRSFIHDITVNPADRELVHAAIAMAQGLKLIVVAEGIETEQQLAMLRELGCNYGQGFLFGKPVPADKLCSVFGGTCLRMVKSD